MIIWLVYFLLHNGFIDYLIIFMNNNRSLSLSLFLFSIITIPLPSHINFSLPVLKFTVKKNFVLKKFKVAFSLVDYSDVFFGLHYS
jgi:uncharacterized protein YehS (DUF1456 family)